MPKVVKRVARKDYPQSGIAKGDEYFYWSIKLQRGGVVRRSKIYPKRSQLTMSDFFGPAYDLDDAVALAEDADALRAIAEEARELGGEQQDKFDNLPEGFQQGQTGELLQERADGCEAWADEIESAADALETALTEIDEAEQDSDEESDERDFGQERDDALQEARDASAMSF